MELPSGYQRKAGGMISDVLSDAIASIESYESNEVYAAVYSYPDIKRNIAATKAIMQRLLAFLDNPNDDAEIAPWPSTEVEAAERYKEGYPC
jgi:hypothetical protein